MSIRVHDKANRVQAVGLVVIRLAGVSNLPTIGSCEIPAPLPCFVNVDVENHGYVP